MSTTNPLADLLRDWLHSYGNAGDLSERTRAALRVVAKPLPPVKKGVAFCLDCSSQTIAYEGKDTEADDDLRVINAGPRMLAVLKRLQDSSLEFDAYGYTLSAEIDAAIAEAEGK